MLAACTQAATDIGGFTGSLYDTWDGLKKAGLEVRTFKQTNLLNPEEKFVRRYLQYIPRSIHHHPHKKITIIKKNILWLLCYREQG